MAKLFARELFLELIELGNIYELARKAGNVVSEAGDLAVAHFDFDDNTFVTLVSSSNGFTGYLVDKRRSGSYRTHSFMTYNKFIHQ